MKTKAPQQYKDPSLLEDVPNQISDNELLTYVTTKDINWRYINAIKRNTAFNDEILSRWLDVSVKTFRTYKKPQSDKKSPLVFKDTIKERVLLLYSVVGHGMKVFGSKKDFETWLNLKNFYFDNKSPNSFLTTVTGMRFVIDRLVAMEYGDNV